MIVKIGDIQIPIRIEKARGRSMSMRFLPEEEVLLVRTPSGKLSYAAKAFIAQKEGWIYQQWVKRNQLDRRKQLFFQELEGGKIPYLGEAYQLQILAESTPKIHHLPEQKMIRLSLPEPANTPDKRAYLKQGLKGLAKVHLSTRTRQLASATDSHINHIRVKSQRSRWGSCSDKANINLNWHLIFLHEPLIDYIIIHELMHLREMNHSPKFWKWVKHFYPEYKAAEKAIREKEWLIGILD